MFAYSRRERLHYRHYDQEPLRQQPPPYLRRAPSGCSPLTSCTLKQEVFVSPPNPARSAALTAEPVETKKDTRNASRTSQAQIDAGREVRTFPPSAAPPPSRGVAQRGERKGPHLVLGPSARRQPGPHRSDGPAPQAADVQGSRRHGLQGDRGRVSVGVAAGLRLHSPADRRGSDPRRRHDPGPDAMSA